MAADLLTLADIPSHQAELGSKTINLAACAAAGYTVPAFMAVPATLAKTLWHNAAERQRIATAAHTQLQSTLYAVRSSALSEDSRQQSLAGQFLTRVDVSPTELPEAILAVLNHANEYLHGAVEQCSLIIQTYIKADVSGVLFTRNPQGERELIIEYAAGAGEQIVSGAVRPQRWSTYWSKHTPLAPKDLPLADKLIAAGQALEQQYHWPQDIEWCVAQNTLYILQTRPITTMTEQQYRDILWLETTLPFDQPFYYAKTELSEIAPRPAQLTLDLLAQLYAPNGPIQRVYQKYGVVYQTTPLFKIIGNELYIDKEQELTSLLPAYSYFRDSAFTPKLTRLSGLGVTLKNIWRLNRISNNNENLFKQLLEKITTPIVTTDTSSTLKQFLEDYQIIFEANLLAGLANKQAELILQREPVHLAAITSASHLFIELNGYTITPPEKLVGNSLDLLDASPFVANLTTSPRADNTVEQWWQTLPLYKQKAFKPKIVSAILYQRLREFGRWLTVKYVTTLRQQYLAYAHRQSWADPTMIFFAQLSEVTGGQVNQIECQTRQTTYAAYTAINSPTTLTSIIPVRSQPTRPLGISAGQATGTVHTVAQLSQPRQPNQKIILYTPLLTPDLTKYFNQIQGIVCPTGGLLSHLAIMAREQGLPIVVNVTLEKSNFSLGDTITIDGTTGEIHLDNTVPTVLK